MNGPDYPQIVSRSANRWNPKNTLQAFQETVVSALMAAVILTAATILASVGVLMAASVLVSESAFRPSHQPV